ncbi:MAG: hypothetical protein KDA44_07400 [Planctomycetales bacterium]|nr:hypothetical protein [Planctomycetales bacterium]
MYASTYSEFVDGDLSNLPSAPTHWVLESGKNVLVGETGAGDYDLLRLTIPAGQVLQTIIIEFHEDLTQVFTGIQAGNVWTAGVGFDVDPAPMLGWVDFPVDPATAHTDVDILADIAQAPGAQGFSPPLPSGDYVMLFQNEYSVVRHALSFNLAPAGGLMPGDFNHDSRVDAADLTMWSGAFGATDAGDANGDNESNGADFLLWQSHYTPAVALPTTGQLAEPATAKLLAAVIAVLSLLRRGMATPRRP